jgi:hypothetical protein
VTRQNELETKIREFYTEYHLRSGIGLARSVRFRLPGRQKEPYLLHPEPPSGPAGRKGTSRD